MSRTFEQDRASVASIASAVSTAATGLELCARRSRDRSLSVAATSAAKVARRLVGLLAAAASGEVAWPSRPRTGERLRWEWLASTGTVLDGEADARLLAECSRILVGTLAPRPVTGLDAALDARLRLVSAEVWSLAEAVRRDRARSLVDALA